MRDLDLGGFVCGTNIIIRPTNTFPNPLPNMVTTVDAATRRTVLTVVFVSLLLDLVCTLPRTQQL